MSDEFFKAAFEKVLPDATEVERWFVCLVQEVQYYGGPEEGGWYGTDTMCVSFKELPSEELASEAAEKIKEVAEELNREARRDFSRVCGDQLEWLEARGYEGDSNVLTEPDEESYRICVCQEIPMPHSGPRHYE